MYSKIKSEIKEIVQIVNECPASLQEKCFEVLLSHLLMEVGTADQKVNQNEVVSEMVKQVAPKKEEVIKKVKPKKEETVKVEAKREKPVKKVAKNEELVNGETKKTTIVEPDLISKKNGNGNGSHSIGVQLSDFHSKVQNFLEASSISIERINDIYEKEDGLIIPLYKDLGTTQPHVVQICLALLSAFEDSFYTGGFEFDVEAVRTRCKATKYYDKENFSQNFANVKQLFKEGAEFEKGSIVKLSPDGLNALAEVLNKIK